MQEPMKENPSRFAGVLKKATQVFKTAPDEQQEPQELQEQQAPQASQEPQEPQEQQESQGLLGLKMIREPRPAVDNSIAFKSGSYSLITAVIVLGILIALNVAVSLLPSTWTKFDISSSKLYSITSNTKTVMNALDSDVTIYWVVQADEEDGVIENLLSKYESISDHIQVVKKNPDTYPTFTEQYTSETVSNNSLIVECESKSRYIAYSDIYLTSIDYTTYSYSYSFDGEGALTSAIQYVTNDDFPQLYILEGHGETSISSDFERQIEKQNMQTQQLSLLSAGSVPSDADCILINAPSSDISTEERDMLIDYVNDGGKLIAFVGPVEDGTLENLSDVIAAYDVDVAEGIVIEGDSGHYAFRTPYVLLPDIQSHTITSNISSGNYYAVVAMAQGLTVSQNSSATVTSLLSTSSSAYSKVDGYDITTYEKEDDDIDGPFDAAVLIETSNGGSIVWVASSQFLDETYDSYSSGANLTFATDALSYLVDQDEYSAVASKSLGNEYLSISDSDAALLKILMLGALPLACVVCGIVILIRRKKANRE